MDYRPLFLKSAAEHSQLEGYARSISATKVSSSACKAPYFSRARARSCCSCCTAPLLLLALRITLKMISGMGSEDPSVKGVEGGLVEQALLAINRTFAPPRLHIVLPRGVAPVYRKRGFKMVNQDLETFPQGCFRGAVCLHFFTCTRAFVLVARSSSDRKSAICLSRS